MSKLGSILQPRALPVSQQNILFSDCGPEVPAMFSVLLKSWQNTGTLPIVDVPRPSESAAPPSAETNMSPPSESTSEEIDNGWMSRLAAEWQIGIETLVPVNAPFNFNQTACSQSHDTTHGSALSVPSRITESNVIVGSNDTVLPKTLCDAPVTYLANKLTEAVQHGTASTVEQVLRLINRQSQSSVAVLREIKDNLSRSSSTPLSIEWETGWDANANSFTRISFTVLNDWSKGSGATKLIIGSDGTTYATFRERWNSTPIYLSPDDALTKVKGTSLKRIRDFNKSPQKIQQSMAQPKTLKAPRHFKVSGF